MRAVTVLLLHGSADSPRCWAGVQRLLEERGIATHAPPLPAAPDVGAALEADLPWLAEQIEALGGAVDLVAHSYGALLALRFSLSQPAAVRRLGLIEPIAFALLNGTPARDGIDQLNARFFGGLDAGRDAAAVRGLVDYWNGVGAFDSLSGGARSRLMAKLPRTRAEVASGRDDATTAAELEGLGMPAFVLAGEHTTAESKAVCRTLAGAIDAPFDLIRGAGHQGPRTHPEPVAAAIVALLRR